MTDEELCIRSCSRHSNGARAHRGRSSVRRAGREPSSASTTPGTNASRDIVSCRIVSVSPGPPGTASLRHEPGSAPSGSPERFPSGRRSPWRCPTAHRAWPRCGAPRSRRAGTPSLLGETHHEDGSLREVRRVEARHACLVRCCVHGLVVEPRGPDHDGHTGCQAPLDVRADSVGPREVHGRVAALGTGELSVHDLVACRLEASRSTEPTFPPTPKSAIFTRLPSSRGLTRAPRAAGLVRPDPGCGKAVDRGAARPQCRDVGGCHRFDSPDDLLDPEQRCVGDRRLPEPRHRFDVDSSERSKRPLRFSLRASSAGLRSRTRRPPARRPRSRGRSAGSLARAHIEADLARIRVLRGVAVHRVRHPPLLADLLEEPRGRRPRGSSPGRRLRIDARRCVRCPARSGRRGTARCPCAGSAGEAEPRAVPASASMLALARSPSRRSSSSSRRCA